MSMFLRTWSSTQSIFFFIVVEESHFLFVKTSYILISALPRKSCFVNLNDFRDLYDLISLFRMVFLPASCSNDVKSLLYYDPSIRFELFLHHASRYQTILSTPDSNYSFSLSFAFLTFPLFHKNQKN